MTAAILRRLSEAVKNGDTEYLFRIYKLSETDLKSRLSTSFDRGKQAAELSRGKYGHRINVENDELYREFSNFESRDELENIISARYDSKVKLVDLAKKLQVHVTKDHDAKAIVEKIVDATLGYRLRAKAIRGEDY
ncbi:hypothetical protein [Mesorhizobium sp. WSM4311]|nr:hypothetical protein [Mesorhizobium sp. WSM4311]PBC22307.1 hypothetical protein CK226_16950 [Mesorhizobium sp. WSM4311]